MAQPGLIRNFSAASIIAANRLVAVDVAADFAVTLAVDASTVVAGATEQGSDEHLRVDVVMTQSAPVEFGETLTAGTWIVPDAQGRAVAFDPANFVAATQVHLVGWAMEDGIEGTIGDVFLMPQLLATIPTV